MKIIFLIPPPHPKKITGGLKCIDEYAKGLIKLGYNVSMLPVFPSTYPKWFKGRYTWISHSLCLMALKKLFNFAIVLINIPIARDKRWSIRNACGSLAKCFLLLFNRSLPYRYRVLSSMEYTGTLLQKYVNTDDIVIASSFDTAMTFCDSTHVRLFYFAQHFEPFFWKEFDQDRIAQMNAISTYMYKHVTVIANSKWLSEQIRGLGVPAPPVCTNAIDHNEYKLVIPIESRWEKKKRKIISYGGRGVVWKGFLEMLSAIRIARETLTQHGIELEWRVYGDYVKEDILPGDLIELGQLSPDVLCMAYNESDILFSGSWYESYPLFPIEAMACGCAVITTLPGTESYAIDNITALIVEPNNVKDMASALIRLALDPEFGKILAKNAIIEAEKHKWETSVSTFRDIIENKSDISSI